MGRRLGHIVVTGAAGFLGGHTLSALRSAGYEVTGIDDLSAGDAAVTEPADLFVRLDVRDRSALYALLSNKHTDAVVHLAGRHAPRAVRRAPEQAFEVNAGGTGSLLGAMRPANVRHLLLGSSLDVYGRSEAGSDELPMAERTRRPTSPYGRLMAAVEDVVRDCGDAWGLASCILRFGELGGRGLAGRKLGRVLSRLLYATQRPPGRTAFELEGVVTGEPEPGQPGSGTQAHLDAEASGFRPCRIDLVHVADAAAATVAAVGALLEGRAPAVANVSRGVAVPVDELVTEAEALSERRFHVERVPLAPGEPEVLVAPPMGLAELGWAPTRSEPALILRDLLGH